MYWGEGVDEPVVSHEGPGAADHSSVDWDVLFDRILSTIRTESYKSLYFLVIVFILFILQKYKHFKTELNEM